MEKLENITFTAFESVKSKFILVKMLNINKTIIFNFVPLSTDNIRKAMSLKDKQTQILQKQE